MIAPFAATRKRVKGAEAAAEDDDNIDQVLDDLLDAANDVDLTDLLDDSNNSTGGDATGSDIDQWELDADREAADDVTIEQIIAEVEAEDALTPDEEKLGRYAVTKVCSSFISMHRSAVHSRSRQLTELAKRVFHSPTLRVDLAACCAKSHIEAMEMIRSIVTRWNTLAEAIGRALYLRDAIDKLVTLAKHQKVPSGKKSIRRFKLTDDEWLLLEQLHPLLEVRTTQLLWMDF